MRKTSKEIDLMFERQEQCVCKMCGGRLEVRTIIHNIYGGQGLDLYCPNCGRIEYGTKPLVFTMAKTFMEEFDFNYFIDLEENDRSRQLNLSKLCEIMSWASDYLEKHSSSDVTGSI